MTKNQKGKISVHPRGFGFIEDIFIPKNFTTGAIDGDIVEYEVTGQREKGPEGRVLKILKRGRTELGARIISPSTAHAPLLGSDREVTVEGKCKIGDRVLLGIDKWEEEEIFGHIKKIIGNIKDPSCDVEATCVEFDIRQKFPQKVIAEAEGFGDPTPDGREDFRKLPCVTIDPASARDFDDALTISKKKGAFELIVHIADVSYYVEPGSALDLEALIRCNSTYFPGACIPMLPPSLSNELCSLKPDVDRYAISVVMRFNKAADLIEHRITRSIIRSKKRFSYEEAKEVLDGKQKSPHSKTLQLMVELCELLKKKRRERGSVEFALPEVVLQVNEKGVPTGTRVVEYDITHQLVEEFMLKANETVAQHLTKLGRGLTYRVHDEPHESDLINFYQMASSLGYRLPKKPNMDDLQRLFDQARMEPHGTQLIVGFIRSMRLATYSPDNIGHYGLSLEHYCHFTSPIRRYADLLVHRVLFDADAYTEKDIAKIAKKCSDQERVSSKAENSHLYLKKLRYLKSMKKRECTAIVTSAKPFGLVFEVADFMLEGFIHISEIGEDYYECVNNRLKGKRTGEVFKCGTEIQVRALDINLITEKIAWEIC